jgi:hypothetical protein
MAMLSPHNAIGAKAMSTITPSLERLGQSQSPVVTLDGLPVDWEGLVDATVRLAPFPPASGIYYPGVRRIFDESDGAAWMPTRELLEQAAPFIAGAFDCDGFTLIEANFSLVTTPPLALAPVQRHPHFDSTDPDFVALIAYLFDADDDDGTAFYRHVPTGIEVVDPANRDLFVAAARAQAPSLSGYFAPGDLGFAEIGRVTAQRGRVGIWRGNLLHSGLIPHHAGFSPDPRQGRLTLNLFLKLGRDRASPR